MQHTFAGDQDLQKIVVPVTLVQGHKVEGHLLLQKTVERDEIAEVEKNQHLTKRSWKRLQGVLITQYSNLYQIVIFQRKPYMCIRNPANECARHY